MTTRLRAAAVLAVQVAAREDSADPVDVAGRAVVHAGSVDRAGLAADFEGLEVRAAALAVLMALVVRAGRAEAIPEARSQASSRGKQRRAPPCR